jgi:hypothetical protein
VPPKIALESSAPITTQAQRLSASARGRNSSGALQDVGNILDVARPRQADLVVAELNINQRSNTACSRRRACHHVKPLRNERASAEARR